MDNPAKTPIACHQNIAEHVTSKKQLSTKTADRHAHVRSYHYAPEMSRVTFFRLRLRSCSTH